MADLVCDVCGKRAGSFSTYEEWSDTALALGWDIGEEHLMCDTCSPLPVCAICGRPPMPGPGVLVRRAGVLQHVNGCTHSKQAPADS